MGFKFMLFPSDAISVVETIALCFSELEIRQGHSHNFE